MREIALRSIHLMVSGNWEQVPSELLAYLKDELGRDPKEDLVGASFLLIKLGVSPEKAVALLHWKGFEKLCERGLEINSFHTKRNIRFKVEGRKHEIDVLAWDSDIIMALDCKMWSKGRSPRAYKVMEAADKQYKRSEALKQALEIGKIEGLKIEEGKSVIVPCVVTWLDFGVALSKKGVPIVPLSKLPSFLNDIRSMIDEVAVLEVNRRIRRGGPSQHQLPL